MKKRPHIASPLKSNVKHLNPLVKPIAVKSTNDMKKKATKGFPIVRRTQRGPTNTSTKAVSKVTSGRPGAGRTLTKSGKPSFNTFKKSIRRTMGYK